MFVMVPDLMGAPAPSGLIQHSTAIFTAGEDGVEASGMALDSNENIIVVGTRDSSEIQILKYDNELVLQSSGTFATGGIVEATCVTVDSLDNILVGGSSDDKFLAVKFSTSLEFISKHISGTSDKLTGIAVDKHDHIYATSDAFWVVDYGTDIVSGFASGETHLDSDSGTILVDSDGYLLVGGYINAQEEGIIKKYNTNNIEDPVKEVIYNGAEDYNIITDVTEYYNFNDSTGHIYGVGQHITLSGENSYFIQKYSSNLEPVGDIIKDYDNSNTDIVSYVYEESGLVIASDLDPSGNYNNIHIRNYNTDLRLKDSYDLDTGSIDEGPADIVIDSDETIYVLGTDRDNDNITLSAFSYNYIPMDIDSISDVKIGAKNNVTVTGNIQVTSTEDVSVTFSGDDTELFDVSINTVSFSTIGLEIDIPDSVKVGNKDVSIVDLVHNDVETEKLVVYQEEYVDVTEDLTVITSYTEQSSLELEFIKDALLENSIVTISLIDKIDAPPAPDNMDLSDLIVKIQVDPRGRPEKFPVLKINYADNNFSKLDQNNLSIVHHNGSEWVKTADTYKYTEARQLISYITDFGIYAVAQYDESVESRAIVYPNPYKPGSGGEYDNTDFAEGIVFSGLSSGSQIKIFNIVGENIHEADAGTDGTYIWNTELDNGKLAPSGLYIYLISGDGDDETGKMSIIR